jgi:hypothetical protein
MTDFVAHGTLAFGMWQQAWEYMGAIMEREQAYKDAADHYEQVGVMTHGLQVSRRLCWH